MDNLWILSENKWENPVAAGRCEKRVFIYNINMNKKLSMLQESLTTFEAEKAQTLAGELSAFTYRGESFAKRMQEISTLINDFELASAAEKTVKLIRSLQEESQ